jgi:hypothetical protein
MVAVSFSLGLLVFLYFVAVLLILISAGVTKYPAVYLLADFLRDAACQATEILSSSLGELACSIVTVYFVKPTITYNGHTGVLCRNSTRTSYHHTSPFSQCM